jgi:translation elongation factor EF-1alpha
MNKHGEQEINKKSLQLLKEKLRNVNSVKDKILLELQILDLEGKISPEYAQKMDISRKVAICNQYITLLEKLYKEYEKISKSADNEIDRLQAEIDMMKTHSEIEAKMHWIAVYTGHVNKHR